MRHAQQLEPISRDRFDAIEVQTLADLCRAWLQCSPDGVVLLNADGRIEQMNATGAEQLEIDDLAEQIGARWTALWPEAERGKIRNALAKAKTGETVRLQAAAPTLKGAPRWWDVVVAPVANSAAGPVSMLALFRDITRLKEADEREAQSRRLESIGRLTGGVAHDFNNLLTVVMSACETLAADDCDEDERIRLANVSLDAAEHGADLVRRLLTFSRRQPSDTQAVDCGGMIEAVAPLVRRTIREDIELEVEAPQELVYCKADRAELESALLNLCINARDAMPRGGILTLSAAPTAIAAGETHASGVKPGRYAMFSVRDTGVGMSRAVMERAIEPFFTTKGAVGGSGFGLATVHGFVQQHGGGLTIESKEGDGACVRLFLPLTDRATQAELELAAPAAAGQGAHVLLVEDDANVRAQAARALIALGYGVTEARDGQEALKELAVREDIRLMMTDLRMPNGMNGRELAALAKLARPTLKVLYTSGYLEEFAPPTPGRHSAFLPKPYRRAQLAKAVSDTLAHYEPGPAKSRERV